MKKTIVSILALLVFTSCFAIVSAQEKYILKVGYPEGKYEMKTETDMNMTTEMAGQKMPMTQKQTQYMEIDAGPIASDGTQKVSMEIKRVTMQQKAGPMDMKYDSDDPDASKSPLKSMGIMVGLKLVMTYGKDGKVANVEGWDEFMKRLEETPDMPKAVIDMMKDQLKPESFTKNMSAAWDIMPKAPIAVGEQWKSDSEIEIPMFGKVKNDMDNTLKNVETVDGAKIAEISSQAKVMSEEPKEMDMGPAKMSFKNMNIEMDTTYKINIDTGLMTSSTGNMKMDMEMAIEGAPEGTQMPKISGTGITTVTVKKI